MKNKSFQKSARFTVKESITRFISIILISFLGVGVFAGLAAVSSNMKRTGNKYYSEQNIMDIRLLSTYGFTEEYVTAIRNTDGVAGILTSWFANVSGTVQEKDYIFRINGLPSTDTSLSDAINQLKIVDGHLPKKEREAVIIRRSIGLKNIELGSR